MAKEHKDKIEDYLLNLLSEEDKSSMKAAIDADPKLQEEVAIQALEQDVMHELVAQRLRNQMQNWDEPQNATDKIINEPKIVSLASRRWILRLSVAASVLLILGVGLRWSLGNQYSYETIANQYYSQEDIGFGRGVADGNENLSEAEVAFMDKNYPQAIQYFSNIPEQDSNYIYGQFMIGKAQLALKNYSGAGQKFLEVVRQTSSISNPSAEILYLKESAEWSDLLTLLATSNTGDRFNKTLNSILQNPEHNYYPMAKKLNQQLNTKLVKWLN